MCTLGLCLLKMCESILRCSHNKAYIAKHIVYAGQWLSSATKRITSVKLENHNTYLLRTMNADVYA